MGQSVPARQNTFGINQAEGLCRLERLHGVLRRLPQHNQRADRRVLVAVDAARPRKGGAEGNPLPYLICPEPQNAAAALRFGEDVLPKSFMYSRLRGYMAFRQIRTRGAV